MSIYPFDPRRPDAESDESVPQPEQANTNVSPFALPLPVQALDRSYPYREELVSSLQNLPGLDSEALRRASIWARALAAPAIGQPWTDNDVAALSAPPPYAPHPHRSGTELDHAVLQGSVLAGPPFAPQTQSQDYSSLRQSLLGNLDALLGYDRDALHRSQVWARALAAPRIGSPPSDDDQFFRSGPFSVADAGRPASEFAAPGQSIPAPDRQGGPAHSPAGPDTHTDVGNVPLNRHDSTGIIPDQAPNAASPAQTGVPPAASHIVIQPNGLPVPDRRSPTGYLMSPTPDLGSVADAGREIGAGVQRLLASVDTAPTAFPYLVERLNAMVGHGGAFDYQRTGNRITGFTQLPHFRNVSNLNVGLLAQQAGLTLEETLSIAGGYASLLSRNVAPDKPHRLDAQTAEFIRIGFNAGVTYTPDATP